MHRFAPEAATPTSPPIADQLARLARSHEPLGVLLTSLLATQCRVAGATAGVLMRLEGKKKQPRVLGVYPVPAPGSPQPSWLGEAGRQASAAVSAGRAITAAMADATGITASRPGAHLLLVPVKEAAGRRDVAAFLVEAADDEALEHVRRRLEIASGLFHLYGLQVRLRGSEETIDHLRTTMQVLEAVSVHERFKSATMAFCNEIAARWHAERVTLGFLDGRYVKTIAISHTERFDRKMRLVRDLESAMEECLDQDTEVVHPRPQTAIYVSRAAEAHALQHGPVSVAALPLRSNGQAVGVLVLEGRLDTPPEPGEMEMLRLTCELVTGRLLEMRRHDRWIGARVVDALRESMAVVVGPRHTGAKMSAVAVLVAMLALLTGKAPDRIDASFEIASIERRVVSAPFAGRLRAVNVEPGDPVEAGTTVLATLETAELTMRLASARAEYAGHLKEADLAMRDGRTVDVQIAEANLHRVEADLGLLEHLIRQAELIAPIDGTVVAGDLRRAIGAPVETGDVLFEIGQLGELRADVTVPEDRIADLLDTDATSGARRGELASVSHPGEYIPFEVERINPVAELVDHRNVFRVRVRLLDERPWLRPGMKGVAKINGPERSYAYLLTRRIVTWVRMKLWI